MSQPDLEAPITDSLKTSILFLLNYHTGRGRAIGRGALVIALNAQGHETRERVVRRAIHELRRAGHLICSAPGDDGGYYLAMNRLEFDEFCERELHPKAIDMLETESAMKRAATERFGDAAQPGLL